MILTDHSFQKRIIRMTNLNGFRYAFMILEFSTHCKMNEQFILNFLSMCVNLLNRTKLRMLWRNIHDLEN
jgi:hypothetical protein